METPGQFSAEINSQASKHVVLVWRPRFKDLDSYLAQADRVADPEGIVEDASD